MHFRLERKYHKKESWVAFFTVLSVLVILLLIRVYPILFALEKSFTNWDGILKNDFIGLHNYIMFFKDEQMVKFIANSIFLMLSIPFQLFFGLIFAMLVYEEVAGWKLFRSISYLPNLISPVVIGFLFTILFAESGPINLVLRALGLDFIAVEWLGSRITGLIVIVIALVWQGIGWQALLILGGLSSMDSSIFEAARIDGASYWTRLFKIIIPSIIRVIEYSVVIGIIASFTGLFSFIFSITKGGPGFETSTVEYMIYVKAFSQSNQMASACAYAIVLLIIALALTKIETMITNKVDDWS